MKGVSAYYGRCRNLESIRIIIAKYPEFADRTLLNSVGSNILRICEVDMKELRFHGNCIITGQGSIGYLKSLSRKRAFIVTGSHSVFANGVYARVEALLAQAGTEVCLFSGVPANPSVAVIEAGLERMRSFQPDTVIGLGGGSALDAAKAMALFYDHPELDVATACRSNVPDARTTVLLICIPSTSGTASEVTRTSVLTFLEEGLKVGVKSPALVPDIAILDSELTYSMPPALAAETGLDAMSHAVECMLHPAADDFTDAMAASAIEGIYNWLPRSYAGDRLGRDKVHNYQCLAGCAFSNVGTIANHGLAHAYGGRYDWAHGLIIATCLPYVLEINAGLPAVDMKLKYLAQRVGEEDFIAAVRKLNRQLGIPACLQEVGLKEDVFEQDLPLLVANTMKGSTRNNPKPLSEKDVRQLLRNTFYG